MSDIHDVFNSRLFIEDLQTKLMAAETENKILKESIKKLEVNIEAGKNQIQKITYELTKLWCCF